MYVTWSSFSLIIFGCLYTDFFFSLEHLWFLYISPDFWVDLCHLCFFVVFVVVGIMFPFFLQVLLVVVWFMTIRFLYVLVGPVYLSQVWYAISWVILGTLSISSLVFCFLLLKSLFWFGAIQYIFVWWVVFVCIEYFYWHMYRNWLEKKFTITLFSTIVDKGLSIFQF